MDFITSPDLVAYPAAVAEMEAHVARVIAGTAAGRIWFLQHPPLYTAGTSANPADLRNPKFPVYETGRGGQYTYHGPGQRVAYVMLDLKQYYPVPDIRAFVHDLEEVIIRALADLGVAGERRAGRIGIWVTRPQDGAEAKIAALGIRVRKGVSYHGISVNVDPDLSHFSGIVPCGISDYGVTSLADLGVPVTMDEVDAALKQAFLDVFRKQHL